MSKTLSKEQASLVSNTLWDLFNNSPIDVDAFFVMVNNPRNRESRKTLSQALFTLLFGFELPKTVLCFAKHPTPTMHIFTSTNSYKKFFFTLESTPLPCAVVFHTFDPVATNVDKGLLDDSTKNYLGSIYENNPKLGYLPNDSDIFIDTYGAHIAHQLRTRDSVNVAPLVSNICSYVRQFKDDALNSASKTAEYYSRLKDTFLQNYSSATSYAAFCELLGGAATSMTKRSDALISIFLPSFNQDDASYNEFFSSKSHPIADFNDSNTPVALGATFYNSSIKAPVVRTMLLDCSEDIIESYNRFIAIYGKCISSIAAGMTASQIYDSFFNGLTSAHFTPLTTSFGSLSGPFDDNSWSITKDNQDTILNDRLVSIYASAIDINDNVFILADTIVISSEGVKFLTELDDQLKIEDYTCSVKQSDQDDVTYDNVDDDHFKIPLNKVSQGPGRRKKISILDKAREAENKKFSDLVSVSISKDLADGKIQIFTPLKSDIPSISKYRVPNSLSIFVDQDNHVVVLPINNRMVPFHASFIKSMTTTQVRSDLFELVILFESPSSIASSRTSKKNPQFEKFGESTFVQELTFRSASMSVFESACTKFKLMQAAISKQSKSKSAIKTITPSEVTIPANYKGKPDYVLSGVTFRPTMSSHASNRSNGRVELGSNGIRCASGNFIVNIPFDNLEGLFVLTANNKDTATILHCHFVTPIEINGKAVKDFQALVETGENDVEIAKSSRMSDMQAIRNEEKELEKRRTTNAKFIRFAKLCNDVCKSWKGRVGKEGPVMDIARADGECSFTGSIINNYLWRTTKNGKALLAVSDTPIKFVWMKDIYYVLFERMSSGISIGSNFDMKIVYKQLDRPPMTINAISTYYAEVIRHALFKYEIPYYYSESSFDYMSFFREHNTAELLKTFEADGGWSYLFNMDDDGSDAESSESEGFRPPEDFDSVVSEDINSGYQVSSEESSEAYEESSAPEWSDLERMAEDSDERHDYRESRHK